MVKLSDIAKAAQTSVATVSKVINHYPGVNEHTRARVMAAIQELGYVPNASARQLTTKKSFVVGVVFTENLDIGLEHPFYAGVIEGFRKTMSQHNYDLTFISSVAAERKMSYLEHCQYRQVDGVYICTFAGDDQALHQLLDSSVPCVTTDVVYQDTPLIVSDNVRALEDAVQYLYDLGHRRIMHIKGPMDTLAARERLEGFLHAWERLRFTEEPLMIQAGEFDYPSGYDAMEVYLASGAPLPEAIIASADIIALGAMRSLQEHEIKVPTDVSIVGVDDIALAEYSHPALTTMAQDKRGLGEAVAMALLARMQGQRIPSRTLIPMQLVTRESTCSNRKNFF